MKIILPCELKNLSTKMFVETMIEKINKKFEVIFEIYSRNSRRFKIKNHTYTSQIISNGILKPVCRWKKHT